MTDPVKLAKNMARYTVVATRATDFMTSPLEGREMHEAARTLADHIFVATGRRFWVDRVFFHDAQIRQALETAHG